MGLKKERKIIEKAKRDKHKSKMIQKRVEYKRRTK